MSDQQDIWASIREKLSLEEKLHLDNAIDKQSSAWQEVQNNLQELQTLLNQSQENTLDIAGAQFSQEIEAHERERAALTYDPDGELKRVEVEIIAGDSHMVAYSNDSVKQFIEKRLALAWTALKNADHLHDLAAPNLLTNQDPSDAAMDIIGKCIEEIDTLNAAAANGDIAII